MDQDNQAFASGTDDALMRLQDTDSTVRLAALYELAQAGTSTESIVRALEHAAIHDIEPDVRSAALAALAAPVHRLVQQRLSLYTVAKRRLLEDEIVRWEADGLLTGEQVQVLRGRYQIGAPVVAQPPPTQQTLFRAEPEAGTPEQPALTPRERATLIEVLLSEATIRIALYLGAFLVLAASFILAALVAVARLPILGIVTLGAMGLAIGLKQRLPLASLVMFIVGSTLIPIDASVLLDLIQGSVANTDLYWMVTLLLLAAVWAAGALSYESWLICTGAFLAFNIAVIDGGLAFSVADEWVFLMLAVTQIGMMTLSEIARRAERFRFFWPLLILSAVSLAVIVPVSAVVEVFSMAAGSRTAADPALVRQTWLSIGTVWLCGALYAGIVDALMREFLRERLRIALPLPGLATFCLMVAPLLYFGAFMLTAQQYALAAATWAAAMAILAEGLSLVQLPLPGRYAPWALAASIILVVIASVIAALEDTSTATAIMAAAFALYTVLSARKLRVAVWCAAILAGYAAWISFLSIPVVAAYDIPFIYAHLVPVLVLLGASQVAKHALNPRAEWVVPPLIAGLLATLVQVVAILITLANGDPDGHAPVAATLLGSYLLVLSVYVVYFDLTRENFRRAVWGLGIAAGYIAYLSALEIQTVAALNIPFVYAHLAPPLLLLTAGEVLRREVKAGLHWVTPLLVAGIVVSAVEILAALVGGLAGSPFQGPGVDADRSVIVFAIFGVYLLGLALYTGIPEIGYGMTASFALAVVYALLFYQFERFVVPLVGLGVLYYLVGRGLQFTTRAPGWAEVLIVSGMVWGAGCSLFAPFQTTGSAILAVAVLATCYAIEAVLRRNVWLGYPTNGLYFVAYITALIELEITEPQFFSIGAALLGIIMHYLLARAQHQTPAFITGLISQLILLSTSLIQMLVNERLSVFFILFFQALTLLAYGLVVRSRSFVITPILFTVLGVFGVAFSVLSGLPTAVVIGCTGALFLGFGIAALLLRERLQQITSNLGERWIGWQP